MRNDDLLARMRDVEAAEAGQAGLREQALDIVGVRPRASMSINRYA